ncbi:MAG: TrpB-like pyridoxal phosphate-dependent enzyme [Gemmatimonadetes bacterium]|jgi:tryptophan synthase beta chain|nr:TrpB-like pyridoxal phosphate-dependent enzyme [Gemmatimonadota bacterium]
MEPTKIVLEDKEIPEYWYNIQADLKNPMPPPLHPGTGEPIGPDDLAPLFPMGLIMQEVSQERWIEIPDEVRQIYTMWRPSPLYRARRLEKVLDTPAHIYYKWEGVSPPGSHKPNTAIPQAYFNKIEGTKRISTETGAGQWGTALSFACQLFDIECMVYMVRVSFEQKPYRKAVMETYGATCIPSPSTQTESGRKILEMDPDTPGSLGIAISEAVEDAAKRDDTHYSLGSVLNHVMLHQTVIGLEAEKQLQKAGEALPDVVLGCFGGGSNFAGMAFPFLQHKMSGEKEDMKVIACEPSSCPTLSSGAYLYDFGDGVGLTPLLAMHTLGHTFVPAKIHAGGLRYHGAAPLASHLLKEGEIEPAAFNQIECFDAGVQFARSEGFIPAPETNHVIKGAIDEALKCKESGEEKVILFNASGHGHFDMGAYDAYFSNQLGEHYFTEDMLKENLKALEGLPKP